MLASSALAEISPAVFARFSELITGELGIKMPSNKSQMLHSRLMRRMKALDIDDIEDYQRYLFDGPNRQEERIHFIDAVTTNKTDFFREPQHFDYLLSTAIPKLSLRRQFTANDPFRLWCAGCSSGEEPYTLAMLLGEHSENQQFRFRLLATDISTRVLDHAREGIYHKSRVVPIADHLRQKYLRRHRDPATPTVRVSPMLREKISFHRLNFMNGSYNVHDPFDVIFFRNVLIYFDRPTQERVINKLLACARSGAFLFVGHSESLAGLDVPVTQVGPAIFEKL